MGNLEEKLRIAKDRLADALKALAPKHKGGEWEEYHAANAEVLRLEKKLAASRGDEYAETIKFPVKWSCGAPLPQLFVNDNRALLAFLISEPDPSWDGRSVTVKDASAPSPEPLGLVEFEHCMSAKLGAPNDEVFHGHPLSGKGLDPYSAQHVVNSRWIKEIEAINSIHRRYDANAWKGLKHYVFWFHDSTFECIARSFKVETHRMSMKALLALMVDRLVR